MSSTLSPSIAHRSAEYVRNLRQNIAIMREKVATTAGRKLQPRAITTVSHMLALTYEGDDPQSHAIQASECLMHNLQDRVIVSTNFSTCLMLFIYTLSEHSEYYESIAEIKDNMKNPNTFKYLAEIINSKIPLQLSDQDIESLIKTGKLDNLLSFIDNNPNRSNKLFSELQNTLSSIEHNLSLDKRSEIIINSLQVIMGQAQNQEKFDIFKKTISIFAGAACGIVSVAAVSTLALPSIAVAAIAIPVAGLAMQGAAMMTNKILDEKPGVDFNVLSHDINKSISNIVESVKQTSAGQTFTPKHEKNSIATVAQNVVIQEKLQNILGNIHPQSIVYSQEQKPQSTTHDHDEITTEHNESYSDE